MGPLLLACFMVSQARCVGPDCPPANATFSTADTEKVQPIWVSNEGRYRVGVIRGGYFIPAVQPAPEQPADTGEMGATAEGETTNYGLDMGGIRSPKSQGFLTNVSPGEFKPAHNEPPISHGVTPHQRAEWVIPLFLGAGGLAFVAALILVGVLLFLKGRLDRD